MQMEWSNAYNGIHGVPKLSSIYILYVKFLHIHAGGASEMEGVGLIHGSRRGRSYNLHLVCYVVIGYDKLSILSFLAKGIFWNGVAFNL